VNSEPIDTLARLTAGISRRGSLLSIGGASLAAFAGLPRLAAGKKHHKKNRKNDDKKCKQQEEQCNTFFAPLCAEEDAPEDCTEVTGACCELLGQCQATAFLDCFFELIRPTEPR
jgi:hypothetical protein